MTYQVYTEAQLNSFSRTQLWPICDQLGCPKYASNQECRDAILIKQPKAIARDLAKKESVTVQEIDFYTHEILVDGEVRATINHDSEHLTQPWVISINGVEVFRDVTYNRCFRWFSSHHSFGTLPTIEVLEVEKIEIVPTVEVGEYKLTWVSSEPNVKTYRCYKGDSMLGVIFQHSTHWSNSVDGLKHFEAIDAAVCLDRFMSKKNRFPVAAAASILLFLLSVASPVFAAETTHRGGGRREDCQVNSACGFVPKDDGRGGPDTTNGSGTR